MLGVCVGGGAEPVEPAVEGGLAPGLEVAVLPAWVEVELEAEVLPPSPALQRSFVGRDLVHIEPDNKLHINITTNAVCLKYINTSQC